MYQADRLRLDLRFGGPPLTEIVMFKHLLLPTDGSEASQAALLEGVRLAKECNARITGISVVPNVTVRTVPSLRRERRRCSI